MICDRFFFLDKNKRECVQDSSEASYVVQIRHSGNDKNTGNKVRGGIR